MTPEHVDTTEPVTERKTVRADQLEPFRHWLADPPLEVLAVLPTSPRGDCVRITIRDADGLLSDWNQPADELVRLATEEEIAAAREAATRRNALDGIEAWVAWMRDHPDVPAPWPAMSASADVETVRAVAARFGWPLQETKVRVDTAGRFGEFTFTMHGYLPDGDR